MPGLTGAGLIGGMPPSTSSACIGLAIATRVLARRVARWSSVALLMLACCPKLLALLLILPDPVEAAMLLYVCWLHDRRGLPAYRRAHAGYAPHLHGWSRLRVGIGALLHAPVLEAALPVLLRAPVTAGALPPFC